MEKAKQIPWKNIAFEIPKKIDEIKSVPLRKYNSKLFSVLAVGFKSIVYAMERDQSSEDIYPLFIKWLQLYVKKQMKRWENEIRKRHF